MHAPWLAGPILLNRLPGLAPRWAPPHPQGAQEKSAEQYDNADDQQVQQALDDDAHDTQRDRDDHQQQKQGNQRDLRSVGLLLTGGPAVARRRRPPGMPGHNA